MAMTEQGLVTLRYQEIFDRIRAQLYAGISPDIDLSADSAIGIILGTVTDRLSELHEIVSEVYDSAVISKAEGIALDDLCQLNDVYRFVAKATRGLVEITGDAGSTISANDRIRSTAGDIFSPVGTYVLTPTQCVEATLKVNRVVPADATNDGRYVVIINNIIYAHVATAHDTEDTILKSLHDQINGGLIAKADLLDGGKTLHIYKDPGNIQARQQSMAVSATSYLTFTKVTINATVKAEDVGAIAGLSGTLTALESQPSGVDKVLNRYDLDEGRDIETDEELRRRYLSGLTTTGKGTSDAILSAVKRVTSVSEAIIFENDTEVTEPTRGIPAKSFEVVVVGGDENDIAQAIWDAKPIGIRAYGTTQGEAEDVAGGKHLVRFMRPTPKYVHVKLTYSIYDEEELNYEANGVEAAIKEAIKAYGATVGIGMDVIPNRIYRYVYEALKGITVHSITAALSVNQQTPPASNAYSAERISVAPGEYTVWESSQYTVTESAT